ncbi:MAG: radical SAM protein [Candidatus Woesearchaeota archaeon]
MKKLKILLLSPPSETGYSHLVAPIGLCYLSANLKKYGFDSKVWDFAGMNEEKIKSILLEEKPDIVGIPCLTIERGMSYKLAKLVKTLFPECIIIFGGQHASLFPEQMFILAPIDYVVLYEGDHTLVELVRAITENEDITIIKGIAYRQGHKITLTLRRQLEQDIDSFPVPDYSNITFSNYISPAFNGDFIPIMSSRGCPYGCAFCSSSPYWEKRFRARSAENVLKEIRYYVKKYHTYNIFFYDDNFIIDKKRLIKICKGIIKMHKKIRFSIAASVRIIDDERVYWLKKAGCIGIGFGMESGSNIILKNIDKPQTKEEIRRAYMLVKNYHIDVGGSLIVGSPGETKETIKETADLLNEILPEKLSYGGIMWILPGTKIYDLAKQKKLVNDSIWLKTNEEIYYTAEHTLKELEHLQILLLYYQAKKRPLKQKIEFLKWYVYLKVPKFVKFFLRKIYYQLKYVAKARNTEKK